MSRRHRRRGIFLFPDSYADSVKGGVFMARTRRSAASGLIKGLLAAVAATLLMMVAVAALAVWLRISDSLLMALNQVMKGLSILLGVTVAVGRGGERGFVTGTALAMLYMALGYGMYAGLGGSAFSATDMLGEILIGAATGGVIGAVLANLPARRRSATRAAA